MLFLDDPLMFFVSLHLKEYLLQSEGDTWFEICTLLGCYTE